MVLNSLGGVFQRQGKFDEAVEAYQASQALFVEKEEERGRTMVLTSLGGVFQRQGKFDEAVEAFRGSADIEERIGNERGRTMVLNSLGGVLQRQGKFDEAVEAFEKSRKISEELDDKRSMAMVLTSLGGVLQRQGKFDEAVKAFEKARKISEELDDKRGQAMVLNSLGGAYQRIGKIEKADCCFENSIVIGQKLEDDVHLAKVRTAFGKALLQRGSFSQAVEELTKGFELDEMKRNRRGMKFVTQPLVDALRRLGREDDAQSFIRRALAIAPNDTRLERLLASAAPPDVNSTKTVSGRIKRVLEPMGRPRFAFIQPDCGGRDIYVNERRIGEEEFSKLAPNLRVEARVFETERGIEACSIQVIFG
jgi:tetratricopeptide (TPR) repeat protein/cold shock CspA family protein